jgi:PST family polysaccharide transporter
VTSNNHLSSDPQPTDSSAVGTRRASSSFARFEPLFRRFRIHFVNLTAFSLLQAASYLIPIVTIPYFARVLGISEMGRLAIAGAAALAVGVVMDYAIQLSGTRYAASHEDSYEAVSRYLSTTTFVKLIILLPVLVAFSFSILTFPTVADQFWIFFWSLLSAVTTCLFPQWLFQGLLVMPLAARILVTCRMGAAVTAMLLVRTPDDAFIVPMTQAAAGIFALLFAERLLRNRFSIKLSKSSFLEIKNLFRNNWPLFSATAWGAVYAHGGIIIMSIMLPPSSIGLYSIAQKISQALVSMFNVAAQTAFPSFVRSQTKAPEKLESKVKIYLASVLSIAAVTLLIMFALKEGIYTFFAGELSARGTHVFGLWLAASFFTILSVSLNPVMVAFQLDAAMASVYRIVALAFLVVAPIACWHFGVLGMGLAMLVVEGAMALFCAMSVWGSFRRMNQASTC